MTTPELEDRQWLEKTYLPTLSGRILYVGVCSFTMNYHKLVKEGSFFETIDKDSSRIRFGSPYAHHIMDVKNLAGSEIYDYIHSLIGWAWTISKGEDTIEHVKEILRTEDRLLKRGGELVIADNIYKNFTKEFWQKFIAENLPNYEMKQELVMNKDKPNEVYVWIGRKL